MDTIYFIDNFKSRRFLWQFHFFQLLFNEKKDKIVISE